MGDEEHIAILRPNIAHIKSDLYSLEVSQMIKMVSKIYKLHKSRQYPYHGRPTTLFLKTPSLISIVSLLLDEAIGVHNVTLEQAYCYLLNHFYTEQKVFWCNRVSAQCYVITRVIKLSHRVSTIEIIIKFSIVPLHDIAFTCF